MANYIIHAIITVSDTRNEKTALLEINKMLGCYDDMNDSASSICIDIQSVQKEK